MMQIIHLLIICLLVTGCTTSLRAGGPPKDGGKEVIQPAFTLEMRF